jgi:multidrug efflux pump subunit AcrB
MTTGDVIAAVREKTVQVAAGSIGQPPSTKAQDAFQFNISTPGRLTDVTLFEDLIAKAGTRPQRGRKGNRVKRPSSTTERRIVRVLLSVQNNHS